MYASTVAIFAIVAASALVAWRWFLAAHVADKAQQRQHELALKAIVVQVDQHALEAAIGKVRQLEDRVKTLEYRPR